jgi:hypothetical protein
MSDMPEYRWAVRGANPRLVRRLRILALQREVNLPVLLNEALEQYLAREEAKERQNPRSSTEPTVTSEGSDQADIDRSTFNPLLAYTRTRAG